MQLQTDYQYIGRSAAISPNSGNYAYYILLYAKSVPNRTTGMHTVTVREVLACSIVSSFYQYTTTFSGTVNGATVFSGTNKPWTAWELGSFTAGGYFYGKGTEIASGSVNVDCSDGLAHSVNLSCAWKFTQTSSAAYVPAAGTSRTVSATVTLPAVPRSSTVSATDAYIGATGTILINRASASYVHALYWKAEGQTEWTLIDDAVSASSYGWTVPETVYNLIPSAKSIRITVRCDTYSGGTKLGSSEGTMTAFADEEANRPAVSVEAHDVTEAAVQLTGDNKKIISGISDVKITVTAQAKNGAAISAYSVNCGSRRGSTAVWTAKGADSANIRGLVSDSRGLTAYAYAEGMELIPYIPLTVNPQLSRTDATSGAVSVNITGNCFAGSFGTVGNSVELKIRFKKASGTESYGEYTALSVTMDSEKNTYQASGTLTGVSYDSAYDIEIVATDNVYGSVKPAKTVTVPISKGVPVFDWGEHDFRFNVPVSMPVGTEIEGMPDHIISCGTWNGWTWRKWSSGLAECWTTVKCEGIVCATAFGAVYETAKAYGDLLYPGDIGFTARPQQHLSVSYTSGLALMLEEPFGTKSNTQSGTGSWYFWRPKASTEADSVTAYVDIYAVGRWKNA